MNRVSISVIVQKSAACLVALGIVVVTIPRTFSQQTIPTPPPTEIKANPIQDELKLLEWISGTWELEDDGRITEEHWRPLQGTTILGSSHTYDATKTYFFEQLRISVVKGQIVYVALPGGSGATTFVKTRLDENLVEFENGQHDYPQRIRYERTANGVTATISLLDGSRTTKYEYRKKTESH